MTAVMLGIDPAKKSHAMAVLDRHENQLAALQVLNDSAGYRNMLRLAKRWPTRTWAVEGAGGVGAQLAQRLVADGETVLDVPPKLATRARMFDQGHGRKNDPGDARTVAVVAIRTKRLRQVQVEGEMVALRLMSERRRELVRSRTETVNRLPSRPKLTWRPSGHATSPAAPGGRSRSTSLTTWSRWTASSKTSTSASSRPSTRPAAHSPTSSASATPPPR